MIDGNASPSAVSEASWLPVNRDEGEIDFPLLLRTGSTWGEKVAPGMKKMGGAQHEKDEMWGSGKLISH